MKCVDVGFRDGLRVVVLFAAVGGLTGCGGAPLIVDAEGRLHFRVGESAIGSDVGKKDGEKQTHAEQL